MIGQRSISFSSSVLPKTTSGMLMARPMMSSVRLPLAAADQQPSAARGDERQAQRPSADLAIEARRGPNR